MKAYYVRGNPTRFLTPYDPDFVEALKASVPWSARKWNPESKGWLVFDPYVDEAIELASDHFDLERLYSGADLETAKHATAGTASHGFEACLENVRRRYREHAELKVWPGAPADVILAAYRAMARLHHPDLGGDLEAMKRINLAKEALCDGRGR
jgi:hypothetical protein